VHDELLRRYDYWRDHDEGLLFVQTDVWLENDFPAAAYDSSLFRAAASARLDSLMQRPEGAQNVQVLTHEWFLQPGNSHWNTPERLEALLAELTARGYQGAFDADDPFLCGLPPAPPRNLRLEDGRRPVILAWEPPPAETPAQYQVWRRDLSAADRSWVLVGQTQEPRFVAALADTEAGVRAYRVYALDERGKRGGSRILTVRLPPATSVRDEGGTGLLPAADGAAADVTLAVYPNPMNQQTTVRYCLGSGGRVRVDVVAVSGQIVRTLRDCQCPAGEHEVVWDGTDRPGHLVASGVYLCRLRTQTCRRVCRLVVLH
jgi:hypothetical protein